MSDEPNDHNSGKAYPLLAKAVQQVLVDRKWSFRAAAAYTGLHTNTIDRLAKGQRVELDSVIAFAERTAPKGGELENVRRYLGFAGKQNVTRWIDAASRQGHEAVVSGVRESQAPYSDEAAEFVEGLARLVTPEARDLVMQVLRSALLVDEAIRR